MLTLYHITGCVCSPCEVNLGKDLSNPPPWTPWVPVPVPDLPKTYPSPQVANHHIVTVHAYLSLTHANLPLWCSYDYQNLPTYTAINLCEMNCKLVVTEYTTGLQLISCKLIAVWVGNCVASYVVIHGMYKHGYISKLYLSFKGFLSMLMVSRNSICVQSYSQNNWYGYDMSISVNIAKIHMVWQSKLLHL
jgi:hypothetical protein